MNVSRTPPTMLDAIRIEPPTRKQSSYRPKSRQPLTEIHLATLECIYQQAEEVGPMLGLSPADLRSWATGELIDRLSLQVRP
jgi:hypothetical protein